MPHKAENTLSDRGQDAPAADKTEQAGAISTDGNDLPEEEFMSAEEAENWTDQGPEDAARQNPRRCLVSGERQSRRCMIRFVLGPDGSIVPDLAEDLPGRGFWVEAKAETIDIAVRKGRFHRAARQKVTVSPDLVAGLEKQLARRCLELLSLARRAGQALAGKEKVNEAISAGAFGRGEVPALYLTARDGAAAAPERLAKTGRGLPSWAVLSGAELGQAFGRGSMSNILVGEGGIAHRLARDLDRLGGFRGGMPANSPNAGQEKQGSRRRR